MPRNMEEHSSLLDSHSPSPVADASTDGSDDEVEYHQPVLRPGSHSASQLWTRPFTWYWRFRKKRLLTVEPVMFLYMFGVSLLGITTSQYVFNRFGQEEYAKYGYHDFTMPTCISKDDLERHTNRSETGQEVQEMSSIFTLLNGLSEQLPSIAAVLLCGPISDRVGRKPLIVLIASTACALGAFMVVLVHFDWNLYYFFPLSFVNGLSGSLYGMATATYSYVADISTTKWLTTRLGILEAMVYSGLTLSAAVVGVWLRQTNCEFTMMYLIYIVCNLLIVVYTILFLPESLTSVQRRERTRDQRHGLFTVIIRGIKIFVVRQYSRWRLWFGLVILAMLSVLTYGSISIMIYYLLNEPLEWDVGLIGIYQTLYFFLHGFCLLVVFPVMVVVGVPDTLLLLGGTVVGTIGFFLTGFVRTTWEMFAVGLSQSFEAVGRPSMSSLMSKAVAAEDQGALFSVIAATQVLSTIAATVIVDFLYPVTLHVGWASGSVYFLMAAIGVIPVPFIITLFVFRKGPGAVGRRLLPRQWSADTSEDEEESESGEEDEELLQPEGGAPTDEDSQTQITP